MILLFRGILKKTTTVHVTALIQLMLQGLFVQFSADAEIQRNFTVSLEWKKMCSKYFVFALSNIIGKSSPGGQTVQLISRFNPFFLILVLKKLRNREPIKDSAYGLHLAHSDLSFLAFFFLYMVKSKYYNLVKTKSFRLIYPESILKDIFFSIHKYFKAKVLIKIKV